MKPSLHILALSLLATPLLAAEQAAPEAAKPRSAPPELLAEGLGETAIGLVLVLLLILALAWAFKRFGGRLPMAARGPVQVIGGVSLGTRERAVLLSVEGTRLLVGVAPGQVRTLHVLGTEEGRQSFSDQLSTARQEADQ
jgi:flagellar protein FliO/FliZ